MEILVCILAIFAIICFILWLCEKRKTKAVKDLETERSLVYSHVACMKAEGIAFLERKKKEALDYYEEKTNSANEKVKLAEAKVQELSDEKAALKRELDTLYSKALCSMTSIDSYSNMRSDEIKNQLSLLKVRQDKAVKSGDSLIVTNSSTLRRVLENQKKQILRCFNAECTSIIQGVTVKNIDSTRSKLRRSYEIINNIFSVNGIQITDEFLSMKFEELSLVYAYMVKIEEEKEQRKAIREQMVEEEKVRRDIEREKQKIEKEEAQFNNEIKKLMGYMQKSKDDVERQLYIDKIKELEDKLRVLTIDKENVLQREQNTRAGFVYIISNIGSFGECIYKIGMTRRLDPMDRIRELSSASVPFPFDVHAMIFSEDAPALETLLHHHFQENQVNKVNSRKEFYRVDLDEIKQLVLENHNATVKFEDIPDALEYRETLKIENAAKVMQ